MFSPSKQEEQRPKNGKVLFLICPSHSVSNVGKFSGLCRNRNLRRIRKEWRDCWNQSHTWCFKPEIWIEKNCEWSSWLIFITNYSRKLAFMDCAIILDCWRWAQSWWTYWTRFSVWWCWWRYHVYNWEQTKQTSQWWWGLYTSCIPLFLQKILWRSRTMPTVQSQVQGQHHWSLWGCNTHKSPNSLGLESTFRLRDQVFKIQHPVQETLQFYISCTQWKITMWTKNNK